MVFEAVEGMLVEHAELEQRLADPAMHSDPVSPSASTSGTPS